jgi:hypothetical protein
MVREDGIGVQSQLKAGTAGTAVKLDGVVPETFSFDNYICRILQMEGGNLTVSKLHANIDFAHISALASLHWLRVLVEYIPELRFLSSTVSAMFRNAYSSNVLDQRR